MSAKVVGPVTADQVAADPFSTIEGDTVQEQLEEIATESGGAHPGLAAHDALGLATDADVTTAVAAEATARATADGLLIPLTQKAAANGVATLDAGSKIPAAQLPAVAITDTFVVNSQAAMLALVAERGDVAVRTDLSKSFILSSDSPGTLADWKELLTPADVVSSVNGRTGAVTGLAEQTSLDTEATTRAAGDAARLVIANNLSDLASAATARTNLGLGTIATQAASNVAVTGGTVVGITDLAVDDGGTGASTAAAARTNLGAPPVPDVQRFETAGSSTWTKPSAGQTYYRMDVVAGGGGGGGGGKGAAGAARVGGGGGGPGGYSWAAGLLADLPGTLTINVGAGGTAGAAQATNTSAGGNGGAGGNSTVVEPTSLLIVVGTAGGGGGTGGGAAGTGGTAGSAGVGMITPGLGAAAATAGTAGVNGPNSAGPAGGGSGAGITTGNATSAGGAGGVTLMRRGSPGPTGGAAGLPGGNAAFPTNIADQLLANGGAGGGSADAGGGSGGAGLRGSGGGGGGAATNDTGNSGAGGVGGAGAIWIVCW